MELRRKLAILADAAKYDASCASSGSKRKGDTKGLGNTQGMGICHSYTPDGRCVSLLKILFTNYCVFDCQYCVNRISSDTERASFAVDEVVTLTLDFYRRNYIEGLFLSSGVLKNPDHTMDLLGEVARKLRVEHGFRGYIHLKAVAGASADAIAKAGAHADRLSVNVELATQGDLDKLAPEKSMADVEAAMGSIRERCDEAREERAKTPKAPAFAPAGQSTQMIVGATKSSDAAILATADGLYKRHRLRRVYYSAFSPIPSADVRLPLKAPPLVREHRLYQADWLIRFYGFDVAELTTPEAPDLALEFDPKLAWALRRRDEFPIDVNTATREELLRVPGFGVRTVERILRTRPHRTLDEADLVKLGALMKRARPFVTARGSTAAARELDRANLRQLLARPAQQLDLFGALASGASGAPRVVPASAASARAALAVSALTGEL